MIEIPIDEDLVNKIETLVNGVIETQAEFYDNPNGAYEFSCPFCCGNIKSSRISIGGMVDIKHDKDCTYILAMEINKEI